MSDAAPVPFYSTKVGHAAHLVQGGGRSRFNDYFLGDAAPEYKLDPRVRGAIPKNRQGIVSGKVSDAEALLRAAFAEHTSQQNLAERLQQWVDEYSNHRDAPAVSRHVARIVADLR